MELLWPSRFSPPRRVWSTLLVLWMISMTKKALGSHVYSLVYIMVASSGPSCHFHYIFGVRPPPFHFCIGPFHIQKWLNLLFTVFIKHKFIFFFLNILKYFYINRYLEWIKFGKLTVIIKGILQNIDCYRQKHFSNLVISQIRKEVDSVARKNNHSKLELKLRWKKSKHHKTHNTIYLEQLTSQKLTISVLTKHFVFCILFI